MNLTQKEWIDKLQSDESPVIIDVRTPEECADGMIAGAIGVDIYKGQGFIYEIDVMDKSKNYFVYCRAGGRSAQACAVMKQLGFANAYNLEGGIMQWHGDLVL